MEHHASHVHSGRGTRWIIAGFSLVASSILWITLLHFAFRPALSEFHAATGLAPMARQLAARHLALWENPVRRAQDLDRMRASNAEWDFMGRTYFVMALANMALREPAQERRYLDVIDAVLDETLRLETTRGMYHFMMDYARSGPFIAQPPRSTFLDGEIAMMLAARQSVRAEPRFAPPLAARIDLILQYLSRGPVMCGESYPDECWMFCNAVAVAAVRMSDRVDGRDHSEFIQRWLRTVKGTLIHKESGLLVSSYSYSGQTKDGPEGSSIWMVAPLPEGDQPRLRRGPVSIGPRTNREKRRRLRVCPRMAIDLRGHARCGFGADRPRFSARAPAPAAWRSSARRLSMTTFTFGNS